MSHLVAWLRARLQVSFVKHLQIRAFDAAIDAEVDYYDDHGSDEVLNATLMQTRRAWRFLQHIVKSLQAGLLVSAYAGIPLYIALLLAVVAIGLLGTVLLGIRSLITSRYTIGKQAANADERVKSAIQSGCRISAM